MFGTLAACAPAATPAAPAASPSLSLPSASAPAAAATSTPLKLTTPAQTLSTPAIGQGNPFEGSRAYQDVLAQMRFGDRPVGSAALRATGDYFLTQLQAGGWNTSTREFDYRGYPVRNIIATRGQGPLIVIGAHYDARARADEDKLHPDQVVPAANDGASGAAVLLELSRVLDFSRIHAQVMLAFFDAEDDGELDMCRPDQAGCDHMPWPWSVGADDVAAHLPQTPQLVVILDMVGDKDQNFYYEGNSDRATQEEIWAVADRLGYAGQFIPEPKYSMDDDHTPFLRRGFRAIDIIDFDYPYWHTVEDTADKVSPESLERIGRVLQTWLQKQ